MVAALLLIVSVCARADGYLIGSSPSLGKQASETLFPPLAELLSAATGSSFSYRYSGNWPVYIKSLRDSAFALMFDEPHLVSWRVEHTGHIPLVKLEGPLDFVIVTLDDDDEIIQLRDLAGRTVCADAPPALDALVLFAQFHNPSRQPVLHRVRDPLSAYRRLLNSGCRGAVLPSRLYERQSRNNNRTRVLFLSRPFPNWAVSADPRLPASTRERIRQALLDPKNVTVTRPLAEAVAGSRGLQPTAQSDYRGHAGLLEDFWGLQ